MKALEMSQNNHNKDKSDIISYPNQKHPNTTFLVELFLSLEQKNNRMLIVSNWLQLILVLSSLSAPFSFINHQMFWAAVNDLWFLGLDPWA